MHMHWQSQSINEIAIQLVKLVVQVPSNKYVFQILYLENTILSYVFYPYFLILCVYIVCVHLHISKISTLALYSFARDYLPVLTP